MTDSVSGEEVRENISSRKTWVRLIYMIVMAIAWNIAEIIFWAVTVLQFLIKLITGATNPYLRRFGRQLAAFFQQTARFETFDTETVPFPFSAWPSGDEETAATVPAKASSAATAKTSGSRKRTTRPRKPKAKTGEAPAPKKGSQGDPGDEDADDDTG